MAGILSSEIVKSQQSGLDVTEIAFYEATFDEQKGVVKARVFTVEMDDNGLEKWIAELQSCLTEMRSSI